MSTAPASAARNHRTNGAASAHVGTISRDVEHIEHIESMAVLAAVFADPSVIERFHWLRPEHFPHSRDGAIFSAQRELYVSGSPVEAASVLGSIRGHGDVVEVLGVDWRKP